MPGVRMELVHAQAKAAGLPLWAVPLPWPCSNEVYGQRTRSAVERARSEDIRGSDPAAVLLRLGRGDELPPGRNRPGHCLLPRNKVLVSRPNLWLKRCCTRYCRAPEEHYFFSSKTGNGTAAFGLAERKSSPTSEATVAATWLCVTSMPSRSPSAGVSGPITPIQMNSAPGTFLPWSVQSARVLPRP